MSEASPPTARDYCPTCSATGPSQECATNTGRDHAARRHYRIGYEAALRAVAQATLDREATS